MGHAHHFLSRLDRISLPQVELALSLYNDAPLLQFILKSVHLPERAERVAISLDHPTRGPFLVTTREGRFVTCLGLDMTTGDLPIITRGQLDGIASKGSELRARLAACSALAGRLGGMGKLFTRLHEAGDDLSREDITAFAGLQPLYPIEMLRLLLDAALDLDKSRDVLLPQLRRTDRLKPTFRRALRSYWNTFWSVGHLAVLTAVDGFAPFAKTEILERGGLASGALSWCAVSQGELCLAIRGAWAVGRMGKPLLPGYKRLLRGADTPLAFLNSMMGLATLGVRHGRLHAEVSKALAAGPDLDREDPMGRYGHAMATLVRTTIDPATAPPETLVGYQRKIGADLYQSCTAHLPPGSPLRFERWEDVPEDVALAMALNAPCDFLTEAKLRRPMLFFLPWVARATPEQLYLPRDFLRAVRPPWEPESSLRLLRTHRDYLRAEPERREGPSRQGPCPCGSGKKYKRCCGVGERRDEESD